MGHIESVTRIVSKKELEAWKYGDNSGLKKWLGVGFENHKFERGSNGVTLYYDEDEGEIFHEVLTQKLTDDFFDNLIGEYYVILETMENTDDQEQLFKLVCKLWPILTIFDEMDNFQLGNESIKRRLLKVREKTHFKVYDLMGKLR